MNEILQSILTEVKILREEVSVLKGQFEDKVTEEETFTNEKERIEAVGYIPKADAAAFLLISTRSICRYKHQFKLVTKQVGREIHYSLLSLVMAVHKYKLPWSEKVYDRLLHSRKLPKMPVS